jgi:hypothetical protein
LDQVEKLSRRAEAWVAGAALEAVAELDWAGRREGLLERIRDDQEAHVDSISMLFVKRNDFAPVGELVSRAAKGNDKAYDALVLLNAFRKPEPYARAARGTMNHYSYDTTDSPHQAARNLASESGIPVVVEIAPPPFPKASFESAFGEAVERDGSSGGMSGGGSGGRWSFFDVAANYFRKDLVPIVEDDVVKIVSREQALKFWSSWAETLKK